MVEMFYEFDQPFVMESGKFTRAFGIAATPLPDAVHATIAWNAARLPAQADIAYAPRRV
jgi:hypothetical protein